MSRFQTAREFLWPRMGWLRTFLYIRHRLTRLSDSTYRIAAGLACGAAVSFTPFVGTHFLQALGLAYVTRANYLASMIGTLWGNPWTFPPLWLLGYKVGVLVFTVFGFTEFAALPDNMTLGKLWEIITEHPIQLFLPWTVGGYLCALIAWPIIYVMSYYLVSKAKLARQKLRMRRLHKEARTITGQRK